MATHPGFVGRRVLIIGLSAGAGFGVAAVLAVIGIRWWWCSLLAVSIVVFIDRASSRGRVLDPWSWIRGLDAQAQVSAELAQLVRRGYHVFEPVDIQRGDVDHVIVGPTGVFAIETKNWPGRIEIGSDGHLRRDGRDASEGLRQAVRNAIAIREMTSVRWVEAILVCVNGAVEGDPIELGKVTITTPAGIERVVLSTRRILSETLVQDTAERLANRSG
jgi:hypothetical protein